MKNTYYYIVTLAMLILAFPVKAASEAEFGKLSKAYTLHADGSQEMRVQKELTLFTHAAMNRVYGESFIIYNPEFQTLKIHDSYTRQKDGTIVKTPENALLEVLPSVAADAPAYNGLKEMVVVHTGIGSYHLSGLLRRYPSGISARTGCVRAGGRAFPNQGICVFAVSARKQTSAL